MFSRGRKLVAACVKNYSPTEDLITLADLEESPTLLKSDQNIDKLAEWSAMMSSEQMLENLLSTPTANSDPENNETITLSEISPSAPCTSAMENNENTENLNLQILEAEDDTDFSSDDSVQDPNDSPEILREIPNHQRKRAKRGRSDKSQWTYEVQVEAEGRRRGLGQRVLIVLENLAAATRMRCVRLTALTHNPSASAFFRACGYILDETSPEKEEAAHYEILSKSTESQPGDETPEEKCPLSEGMRAVQVANTQ